MAEVVKETGKTVWTNHSKRKSKAWAELLITSDNIGDLMRTLPKEDALRLFREACRRDPSPHWNQASDDWIEGAYYMIIMNEV